MQTQDYQGSVALTLTLMTMCPHPLPLNDNNVLSHSTSLQRQRRHTLALALALSTTMTTCYQHHSCSLPDDNMKTMTCPHPLNDRQWRGALALTLSERFLEGGKLARRLSRETQSSCADNGLNRFTYESMTDYVQISSSG